MISNAANAKKATAWHDGIWHILVGHFDCWGWHSGCYHHQTSCQSVQYLSSKMRDVLVDVRSCIWKCCDAVSGWIIFATVGAESLRGDTATGLLHNSGIIGAIIAAFVYDAASVQLGHSARRETSCVWRRLQLFSHLLSNDSVLLSNFFIKQNVRN